MDENELKVITLLSKNSGTSQRDLSKMMNLSLGMVNIVLHRLIEKGLMKVNHLNGRNVQYILTPKGIYEKTNKARQYLNKTIDNITIMKETLKAKMEEIHAQGAKKFYIIGDWDLTHIIGLAVKELNSVKGIDIACVQVKHLSDIKEKNAVIFCDHAETAQNSPNGFVFVDIADLLAEKMLP